MTISADNLESLLPQFGLTAFRPGQKEVIETVLSGKDCLCVMPTGGGKSLCYQLPAIALEGLTLVVSPLIALMKDQVDQLQARGIPVAFINSTLPVAEQYARLDDMASGKYRLLYVVPERFRSERFLEAVRNVGLKLLAIDEAHCISEWGHDFRPDYAKLGYFRRLLGNPTTIALTATATDRVRRDIEELLALESPRTFITGFARPNLYYEVRSPRSEREKIDMLVDVLKKSPGSGIIYTSTRKRTEEVAAAVAKHTRRKAAAYHAGLSPDERRNTQDAFMSGRLEVITATNAFGMGIDKSDVRFVIHYNLPGSVEAYYQEAGRAGRDGHPSKCVMLYHGSDRYVQEFFIENSSPGRDVIQQVYDFLRSLDDDPIEMTQRDVKDQLGLSIGDEGVGNCEHILERAGVLERLVASQNMASVRLDTDQTLLVDLVPQQAKTRRRVLQAVEKLVGDRRYELVYFRTAEIAAQLEMEPTNFTNMLNELSDSAWFSYVPPFRGRAIRMVRRDLPFDKLEIDFEALEKRKQGEYDKLNRMVRFAMSGDCRQQQILRYFGEANPKKCGHCDNCGCKPPNLKLPKNGEPADVVEHGPVSELESNAAGDALRAMSPAITQTVQKVLSGVARASARFACGKTLIAQMLCGSTSAKVTKLHLNKLTTFGLLTGLKQPEVVSIIDLLIAVDCLEQEPIDRFRPVLRLTTLGNDVMRGKSPLPESFVLPGDLAARINVLFKSASRELRPIESESKPAAAPPQPAPSAPSPPLAASQSFDNRAEEIPNAETPAIARPAYYWTWRLFTDQYTFEECLAIRGITRDVVLDHLLQAANAGLEIRAAWCLSAELCKAIEALLGTTHPQHIRPLLAQLPTGTQYAQVEVYLRSQDHLRRSQAEKPS